jgi:hypothetical protein
MDEVKKLDEHKKSLESEISEMDSSLCRGLNKINDLISKENNPSYPMRDSVKLLISQEIERAIERRDNLETKFSEHQAFIQRVRESRTSNYIPDMNVAKSQALKRALNYAQDMIEKHG